MPRISAALPSVPLVLFVLIGLVPAGAEAQQTVSDPTPPATTGWMEDSPFRPLELPAANRLRTGSGAPGPDYWQQKVDYRMTASVDTAGSLLTGTSTITYHNRSPELLPYLWLKLDANLCDPAGTAAKLNQPPLMFGDAVFDFSCAGGAGMTVSRVESRGRALRTTDAGTRMRVELPEPLRPGQTIEIETAWSWPMPDYGYGRMGRDGTLYQVAQWYPRVAVFDDLSGWNIDPFLGAGEFYQEFGDFDVELTVPAG
ncbi:MAG: hypothetical protein M8865_04060, partial [marine benthic group bacterium]|nr:hypothetical protein [Gemmatimonadota bacterium]